MAYGSTAYGSGTYGDPGGEVPGPEPIIGRVAVNREFPPVRHRVIIRDPRTGAAIARWAQDEAKPQNVMSGLKLSGALPGGKKELRAGLSRNPRQDWPDTDGFLEVEALIGGRKRIWHGRIGKAPRSDGERWQIDGEAVGYGAALEDRRGLRIGIIDSDVERWEEPSNARVLHLIADGHPHGAEITSGRGVLGADDPGITISLNLEGPGFRRGERWYYSGGPDIGAFLYDFVGSTSDPAWYDVAGLWFDNATNYAELSPDYDQVTSLQQRLDAGGPGRKFASITTDRQAGFETHTVVAHSWRNLKVLGRHGLPLQGTWPNVGYTTSQILRYLIPEYSGLRVTDESVEDSTWLHEQAWFADPPVTLRAVIEELVKPELYDWFVRDGKVFEFRKPGTYGRRWQAYQGPANFQEAGSDTERSWDRIVVGFRDPSGRTLYVGYPGSGADVEDPALQITDPNHPAVRSETVREDLLMLQVVTTAPRAIEAGERWLQDANELPRSGRAEITGWIKEASGAYFPAGEIAEGDLMRFPDGRDKSYRKIVDYDYDADTEKCVVSLDAPSESLRALQERFQAVLVSRGVS